VDLHGDNVVDVWHRPTSGPVRKREEWRELVGEFTKRSNVPERVDHNLTKRDQPNGCYSPDQLQTWFGAVPW